MTTVHYLLVLGIFWGVLCRAKAMAPDTHAAIKVQYGSLMLAAVAGLPIFGFSDYASHFMAAALCLYLLVDAQKWRGAPPVSPWDLSARELRRMFGRK